MRTLFLQAPSYDGFDGGAGSRYQARREIRSFWYPTWLAQPAALVEGSKLVDAPPHGRKLADVVGMARDFDLVVLHTSAPSFASDVRTIEAMKEANPALAAGMIGAKVAVDPQGSLEASRAIDFVAGNEFDFTLRDVAEGRDLATIDGLSYRDAAGRVVHNPPRAALANMDELPFVTPVYQRDLDIDRYFIGYLRHPYVSLYTGRGCKSRCTFCLWPQTVGGHRYRTRSVGHVVEEIAWAQKAMPQVKEFFFDDDTFTDDLPRAEAIARELGKLGVTWSCNAKANVPRETLRVLRDNGLRLLLVGYETGNQQILLNIKKGMRVEFARRFTRDCRDLGITIHGTFILGLPGETRETIEETIRFATEIDPHTIQVSLAAPYPGTFLHRQALENGWLDDAHADLVDAHGVQIAPLSYPHLSHTEIFDSVETFYRRFYFRAGKIASIVGEMARSPEMMRRRLREGLEFFQFLRERRQAAHAHERPPALAPLASGQAAGSRPGTAPRG
jgi:hopanoid biosynthesis associated radical SAM protein HpnJ